MRLRRNRNRPGHGPDHDVDTLLQLQLGEELARRYVEERIETELRAADVAAREARADEQAARIAELEEQLARALAQASADPASAVVATPAEPAGATEPVDRAHVPVGAPPAPVVAVVPPPRRRLGKQLVAMGVIKKRVVREALEEQEYTGARLGEIFVARGALTPIALRQALAQQDGVGTVRAGDRAVGLLPPELALAHRAVVLSSDTDTAPTAVAVMDLASALVIAEALGRVVEPRLADAPTMLRLLAAAYIETAADLGDQRGIDERPEPVAAAEQPGMALESEPAAVEATVEAVDATVDSRVAVWTIDAPTPAATTSGRAIGDAPAWRFWRVRRRPRRTAPASP